MKPRFIRRLLKRKRVVSRRQVTCNLISELFSEIAKRTEDDKLRDFATVMSERSKTGSIFVDLSDFIQIKWPTQADIEAMLKLSNEVK